MTVHNPIRPSWICGGCGREWPCETRRRELLAEYWNTSASLGIYMAAQFSDARVELPRTPPGVLYHRFLGWLGALHRDRPGTT